LKEAERRVNELPGPNRIVIEIRPESQPISGTIYAASVAPRSFCGWLELISALDERIGDGAPGNLDGAPPGL
jgi:hypothetical protein